MMIAVRYLKYRCCTVHLEFRVTAIQIGHKILNHAFGTNRKSVAWL